MKRLLAAPLVVLLACAEAPFSGYPSVLSVTISPDSDLVEVGATLQLSAIVRGPGGVILRDRPVYWSSSNPGVAVISNQGVLQGQAPGRTVVTATAEQQTATALVDVRQPVASVTVDPGDLMIVAGGSLQLIAIARDSDLRQVPGVPFTWSSSDPGRVSVSPAGVLTAHAPGTATISAHGAGRTGTATITVTTVRFTSLAGGDIAHACGVTTTDRVFCWGDNTSLELGIGTGALSAVPVGVWSALPFVAVSGGGDFTCGLTTSGAAYCWGTGTDRQLGDALLQTSPTPVLVPGGLQFASLSAGILHSCALTTGGEAWCWGMRGGLGNYETPTSPVPLPVLGNLRFRQLASGYRYTCGLAIDSTAYCWGLNNYGQMGSDSLGGSVPPVPVNGGMRFVSITTGERHSCGLTALGAAYCWGDNYFGQLGTGPGPGGPTPAPVSGGLTFTSLSAGVYFTCGLVTSGGVSCWGENTAGQLGTSATENCGGRPCNTTPVTVSGGESFAFLAAGAEFVCGLAVDGYAYCWGSNSAGQLGTGTRIAGYPPMRVAGQQ